MGNSIKCFKEVEKYSTYTEILNCPGIGGGSNQGLLGGAAWAEIVWRWVDILKLVLDHLL